MSGDRPIKRRNYSEEQRERLRQNAKKLVAEGKFGGRGPGGKATWGQGGRQQPRFAPKPEQLIAILEAVALARNTRRSDDVRRLLASVPDDFLEAVGLDREKLVDLLAATLSALLERDLLPRKALFAKGGTVELVWDSRSRGRPDEKALELFDPRPRDFGRYTDAELLDVLAFISDAHLYHCPQAREASELVETIVRELADAVERLLAGRKEPRRELFDRTH